MNQIETQIDNIIMGLKRIEGLSGVRFVKEYKNHKVENPITGFIAVVYVTDTALSKGYIGGYLSSSLKGEQFFARTEIRVYAPVDENGTGLSEIISEILTGLKKADTEKIIVDVSATSIKFDTEINSIYRTVEFNIEFCLCEEA